MEIKKIVKNKNLETSILKNPSMLECSPSGNILGYSFYEKPPICSLVCSTNPTGVYSPLSVSFSDLSDYGGIAATVSFDVASFVSSVTSKDESVKVGLITDTKTGCKAVDLSVPEPTIINIFSGDNTLSVTSSMDLKKNTNNFNLSVNFPYQPKYLVSSSNNSITPVSKSNEKGDINFDLSVNYSPTVVSVKTNSKGLKVNQSVDPNTGGKAIDLQLDDLTPFVTAITSKNTSIVCVKSIDSVTSKTSYDLAVNTAQIKSRLVFSKRMFFPVTMSQSYSLLTIAFPGIKASSIPVITKFCSQNLTLGQIASQAQIAFLVIKTTPGESFEVIAINSQVSQQGGVQNVDIGVLIFDGDGL